MVVELFEVTNGFAVMHNTYDPVDLVANAAGVGLALAVDAVWKIAGDQRVTAGPDASEREMR